MKNYILLTAAVLGGAASSALGCDICALYSAAEANGEAGKGFYAGLAQQYTDISTLQFNGDEIPNSDHEYIHSSVTQIFGGYNFSRRFGVQINLPLIARSYGWTGFHGSDFGPGDLSITANFTPVVKQTGKVLFSWTLLGGVKLPTGDTSWLGPRGASLTALGIGGHDLTLGSGSVDGIVGTSFSFRRERLFFNAGLQYALRTEGDYNHRFANDLTWGGGPGMFLLLDDRYTLAVQAVVSGEAKGMDTQSGIKDPDSAETIVYVGPQINFTWSTHLSAQAGVDVPVSIANSETQAVPDIRVRGAVTWRF